MIHDPAAITYYFRGRRHKDMGTFLSTGTIYEMSLCDLDPTQSYCCVASFMQCACPDLIYISSVTTLLQATQLPKISPELDHGKKS
jgi:hypothetical protein